MWRHSFKVIVPKHGLGWVKIALAWNKDPSAGGHLASNPPTDFDLHVFDEAGALVAWSASFENSYEVVEFAGTQGKTYTIQVQRSSGEEDTYYGIAWSVRSLDPMSVAVEL